jgi:hypothetical protein
MLNKVLNVQASDTTGDDGGSEADYKKYLIKEDPLA